MLAQPPTAAIPLRPLGGLALASNAEKRPNRFQPVGLH